MITSYIEQLILRVVTAVERVADALEAYNAKRNI